MYSTALLILYVICESDELFYSIRNSYVKLGQSWLSKFRDIPIIRLVIQMINLELSVEECLTMWSQISNKIERLSKSYLQSEGVDISWLELQGEVDTIEVIEK